MYYKGTPFVKEKGFLKDNLPNEQIIFSETPCDKNIAEKIIMRLNRGIVDYIYYINAKIDNAKLWEFHIKKYGNILYFKESFISENIIKQIAFESGILKSYKITIYSDTWLELKEQIYNEYFELVEYHEFFYKENQQIPFEEKIFYTSNWIIHKEEFL